MTVYGCMGHHVLWVWRDLRADRPVRLNTALCALSPGHGV